MLSIICLSMLIVSTVADLPILVPKNIKFKSMPNVDGEKFLGKWYQYARTSNDFEPSSVCNSATLVANTDGTMGATLPSLNTITGYTNSWGGSLSPMPNGSIGEGEIQFPAGATYSKHRFVILDTDYCHYGVGIMLQDAGLPTQYVLNAWIISRHRTLGYKFYKHAVELLRRNHVPVSALKLVAHHNCKDS